jgi:uncharacterized membrane protein
MSIFIKGDKPMKNKRIVAFVLILVLILSLSSPALADEGVNPVDAVNNLISVLYWLVTAIGIIFVIMGVIQLAMAFKENDPSNKSRALQSIIGGVLAIGVRFVVQWLTTGFSA